jgi:hypothetical protein
MTKNPRDIITEWNDGLLTRLSAISQLSQLASQSGPDSVFADIPDEWRTELEHWIYQMYDNDLEPDAFVTLGGTNEDSAQHRLEIEVLRGWIRERRTRGITGPHPDLGTATS